MHQMHQMHQMHEVPVLLLEPMCEQDKSFPESSLHEV
jgi:hypothetical protein